MSVHEDIMQGLQEALDYVNGDKSKARSTIVTIPDEDINSKYKKLTTADKIKVEQLIENMLTAYQKVN